ncbi:UNVERIFIED_CONTAM: hypothetical protein K2H54_076626, partial [Gekko kuhli]
MLGHREGGTCKFSRALPSPHCEIGGRTWHLTRLVAQEPFPNLLSPGKAVRPVKKAP